MNPLIKIFDNLIQNGFEAFGRYYSSYRGFVVDNNDTEGYGRLKLLVPQIYGNQVMDYWAWPKNNYSGKNYGMQCIPNKQDMVFVEFEMGDPRKPIWTYGHFGKNEKPSNLRDIKNFWFKTPEGNLVEFDDTKKQIRITDCNSNTLIFTNQSLELNGNSQSGVLGEKNEIVLNDIRDILNGILTSLGTMDTTLVTICSSLGIPYISQSPNISLMNNQTSALTSKITQTKSTKVKLS